MTDKKITSEADAREVMDMIHSKGPTTVILSSTELGSDKFLLGMASSVVNGVKTVVKVMSQAKIVTLTMMFFARSTYPSFLHHLLALETCSQLCVQPG